TGPNGTPSNGNLSPTGFAPSDANLANGAKLGTIAPSNGALSNGPLSSALDTSPLGANPSPATGTRLQLTLVPPDQQSAQLKELEQRLARSRQQMTPQQAAQAYNEEVKL